MRFVKVEQTSTGYLLDPNAYLDWLETSATLLPAGAFDFAVERGHYVIHDRRCVKDLQLDHVRLTDRQDALSLEILFAPNPFKHDQELIITYTNVFELSIKVASAGRSDNVLLETKRLGDFQLDEILPHVNGCSHEIQMTGGILWIVSGDLCSEWRDPSDKGH